MVYWNAITIWKQVPFIMKNKFILTLFFLLTIVVGKPQITEIDARVTEINNLIVEST